LAKDRFSLVNKKYRPRHGAKTKILKTYQRVLVWMLSVSLVLAGSAVGFGFVALNQFEQGTTVIDEPLDLKPEPAKRAAENILLMGTDTRGNLGTNINKTGYRSDTIMILHIEEDREKIQVISIPRDTWVTIPGFGKGKINWALSFGGAALAVKTISEFMKIEFDHVVLIDFNGVIKLSEVLDGIPIDNPQAFTSDPVAYPQTFTFDKGEIILKGPNALAFVRERHAFSGGDVARIENQQRFIKAVISRILSAGVISNPGKVLELSNTIGRLLIVDKGLNSNWILNKAVELSSFNSDNMKFYTIPIKIAGYEMWDGMKQYVLYANEDEITKISGLLSSDSLSTYLPPPQAKTEN
jgi:LCP family protein required for cell wall assembly